MSALSGIVLPSGAAYLLFVLGLLTYVWRRTRRASWWLLAASGAATLIFSSGLTAAFLMSPLESANATVRDAREFPDARKIVVLTGWAAEDANMPLSTRLNPSAAYRVLMALELFHDRPDCEVIVSGDRTTADVMGAVLVKLGVPASQIAIDGRSLTTADSAVNLRPLVGDDAFFLVTSAGHLPRALAVVEKQRLHAIPVATDHQSPRHWQQAEPRPRPS
ncbi:MAG: YdcF family protein, partial [Pseudomonadota bacterium]|nr:YdcF family protein [Pseudomonadota bacterium]